MRCAIRFLALTLCPLVGAALVFGACAAVNDRDGGLLDDGADGALDKDGEPVDGDTDGGQADGDDSDGGDGVCSPDTCQTLGAICGSVATGCGDHIFCGDCPTQHLCHEGRCICQPDDCATLGLSCGPASDGCGNPLDCGACPSGQICQAGLCAAASVDCGGIAADPAYELCEESTTHCAGVFTDGSGCGAFCAAAGLACTARYGGEPGCQQEATPIACAEDNGHLSDWCVCGEKQVSPDCQPVAGDPPSGQEQHYIQAVFTPRTSWVLACRDYAYTARYEEHEACDAEYQAGSGRGMATFTFSGVARGSYDVHIEGRHTTNRNPAGALVTVESAGHLHTAIIDQRDDAGLVWDLHGRYCLEGGVVVIMDSSVSAESDSIRSVRLTPANP